PHAHSAMVLLCSGQGDPEEAGPQDRNAIARRGAGRDALLFRSRRAPQKSEENLGTRQECGDAVFAEERDSVCGDGGRWHRGTGEELRLEGRDFGRPGAEVRSLVARSAVAVTFACRQDDGPQWFCTYCPAYGRD